MGVVLRLRERLLSGPGLEGLLFPGLALEMSGGMLYECEDKKRQGGISLQRGERARRKS